MELAQIGAPPNRITENYCALHFDHPLCRDNQRNRQSAGSEIFCWAYYFPQAFDNARLSKLHSCLLDCDASIRWDILKAISFL